MRSGPRHRQGDRLRGVGRLATLRNERRLGGASRFVSARSRRGGLGQGAGDGLPGCESQADRRREKAPPGLEKEAFLPGRKVEEATEPGAWSRGVHGGADATMIELDRTAPVIPTPIPLTARFRPRPGVLLRRLEDEAVLLDSASGRYFGLNATGSRVFELLDGERTLEAVVERLLQEHAVDRERLQQDVAELVSELRSQGLVVEASTE